jgi:uncharacterized SAM-binding protein YcdF (DUF218 family)
LVLILPRLIRWCFRLAVLAIAGALVYLGVTAYQIHQAADLDQAGPAQAIVVMGAAQYDGTPSPDLAARLNHAFDLWHRNYSSVLVVIGGRQLGDVFTEAQAAQGYLESKGVPDSEVVPVGVGNNSWQSLSAAATVLKGRDLRHVILVSDPFHDERIRSMAEGLGLSPLVSPTRTSPIKGTSELPYYAKETVAVALGRLVGYRNLSNFSRSLGLVQALPEGG